MAGGPGRPPESPVASDGVGQALAIAVGGSDLGAPVGGMTTGPSCTDASLFHRCRAVIPSPDAGESAVTRSPRFEDVLGPLAAAIVREVTVRGDASVADVVLGLRSATHRNHAYTTVMTVMGRLHERGVLLRELRGRQYIYRATAPEAELVDRLSGLAVDRLIERYGTAALRHFAVRLADLDPEIRQRLAVLADQPE